MSAHVIDRPSGRSDGEEWAENYTELPGGPGISLIMESTREGGRGPRLHLHPYAETFVIRRGGATFTVGAAPLKRPSDRVGELREIHAHAGQILVVEAWTPHRFVTDEGGYEAVHIHSATTFEQIMLE
ncbi:cupin domain [Brevibacterium sanguinis]|uniref:Cupin domain n=2 Tax=Brevibacterium TaxID=1696 RepID=A0A366IIK1_9MICO|nr:MULTISPECIES: cupin domain-containing protein [Brevibacterium]RBP64664.1 cupin domain [Brevibacterium sanguinis]RBP71693.1 cupin domain [Brevibacterium celere]